MKKLQILFIVAIAALLTISNAVAGGRNVDIGAGGGSKAKIFENYTFDFNYKNDSPTNTSKKSDVLLGETTDIEATWLPNEEMVDALGSNQSGQAFAAPVMYFPKENLQNFYGFNIKQINNIQFSVSNIAAITQCSVVVIVVKGQTVEFGSAQNVPNVVEGWNIATLTTPFEITDDIDGILVGYAVNFNAPAYILDITSPAVAGQNYFYWGSFSSQINEYGASFLIKMGVTAETDLTAPSVLLSSFVFPQFVQHNNTYSFSFNAKNVGTTPITSMEVSCKLGDQEEIIIDFQNIENFVTLATLEFTYQNITIPASQQIGNNYPIKVTITKLNGKNISNSFLNSDYYIPSFIPTKRVFGEQGTGAWCQWCPRGIVAMRNMKNTHPDKWIGVAVHNNDPMALSEYDKEMLKITNSNGYPNGAVDRRWGGDPGNFPALFDILKDEFGYAELSTVEYLFDPDTRKIDFIVKAKFAAGIVGDYRFMAVVTEDSVRGTTGYSQANAYAGGANGPMGGFESLPHPVPADQMFYNSVARAVLGTPYGEAGSLPTNIPINSEHTHTFSYTVPSTYNYDFLNIAIVLLNVADTTVFNAIYVDKNASIQNDPTSIIISTYPNPTKGDIAVELKEDAKITIWSIEGNKLYEGNNKEGVSNIKLNAAPGSYILRTENKNGSHTTKFVVE